MPSDSSRISPTALFTSYVWYAHGMSHEALTFPLGRMAYQAFRPFDRAYAAIGRANLEMMLLARHQLIDAYLEDAIAEGVTQVLEIAAGYSPRGWRMTTRHPALTYVEADLPAVAAEKRARLDGARLRGPRHQVVELDALAEDGPLALPALFARHLDARQPTAVISEGLLGYFDQLTVEALWRRIANQLRKMPFGYYLADINVKGDVGGRWAARVFRRMLELVARGSVHIHYADAAALEAALRVAGFTTAEALHPRQAPPALQLPRAESQLVRVVRARVG